MAAGTEVVLTPEVARVVDALEPDAVVVSSYDRTTLGEPVARCPFSNVHYAPLPRYGGRATVKWAIINGEPRADMLLHCLEAELDAGVILAQETIPIGPRDTVVDLYPAAVERRLHGDTGFPQDEGDATYTCSRIPEDGEVDWSASTGAIDRSIRALGGPSPPAYTYDGLTRLGILAARPVPNPPRFEGVVPGRVVRVDRGTGEIDVLTGEGVLRIEQISGRRGDHVAPAKLVRSLRATLGLRTKSLLSRIRHSEAREPVAYDGARRGEPGSSGES